MFNIGSLNDFMNTDLNMPRHQNHQEGNRAEPKHTQSMKKVISIVSQYVPSKKPALKKKISNKIATQLPNQQYDQYFKRRQFMSEQKINFLPASQMSVKSQQPKPKRGERLLRAISKVEKQQKSKEIYLNEYERNFDGLKKNLVALARKDIFLQKQDTQKRIKEIKLMVPRTSIKQSISKEKRIEYEKCLDWAKKHKKHGQFYQRELGKNKRDLNLSKSFQQRKKLIKKVHDRYKSQNR